MMPLVSIIIPTYNRSKLIHERALKSALAQNYENKQIIVVDDGSTDSYENMLDSMVHFEYYKPWWKNRGGSAARNFGLSRAWGRYIVFIDDDNMLDKDFLSRTVPVLETEGRDYFDAVTTHRYIDSKLTGKSQAEATKTDLPAIDWGWLIRRRVFEKVKYDEQVWGDEDICFGIDFMKAGFSYEILPEYLQTAYAPDAVEEQTSNTFPTPRRLKGLRNFLEKHLDYYTDPNERRYILRLAGRNYLRGGHYFMGIKYFWQSLMCKKNWKTFKHFFFALFGWKVYDSYMSFEERKL